jgi:hypothetical protein
MLTKFERERISPVRGAGGARLDRPHIPQAVLAVMSMHPVQDARSRPQGHRCRARRKGVKKRAGSLEPALFCLYAQVGASGPSGHSKNSTKIIQIYFPFINGLNFSCAHIA